MVDIAPFRALRYATPPKKNDISKDICPPYDVVSAAERELIVKRGPHNVIQLELPVSSGNPYEHAGSILRQWTDEGVLQQDRSPAFYLLETTFKIADPFAPNKKLKRYGVLSSLRLEPPGKGAVHPHEKTLPKAKEDRLNLITATRTNVSPIFGLFFDKKKEWKKWVAAALKQKPVAVGTEKKDLSHRLWKIDDPKLQQRLREMLSSKDLYIADGHHRYEVAWAYREGRLMNESGAPAEAGWRRVMAYVCPMEEPGLLMLPTHRLVRTDKSYEQWKSHLERYFDIVPVKNMKAIVAALSKPAKVRTIGWSSSEGEFLLKFKKGVSLNVCLQSRPAALRELDVVLLHDVILGESTPGFLDRKDIVYTRDLAEIRQSVTKDPSWTAFLLGSSGVASLARVSAANEVMPPKTTYFYPKVPTGFTLMPLDQRIS